MFSASPHQVSLGRVYLLQQLSEYFIAVVHIIVAGRLAQPQQVVGSGELLRLLLCDLPLNFDRYGCIAGIMCPTRICIRDQFAALLLQSAYVHVH